jgi:hypothetical protein
MGKPLMLSEADAERIESLKKRLRARTKTEVVRSALDLLERDAERAERVAKWRRVAGIVARESRAALRDFRPRSRLRRMADAYRVRGLRGCELIALDPRIERPRRFPLGTSRHGGAAVAASPPSGPGDVRGCSSLPYGNGSPARDACSITRLI